MSAFPNDPATANASKGTGGLGGGVKKKVTKKRRNILASQLDECKGEDETEQKSQAELRGSKECNDQVNNNSSSARIDCQSDRSDSDIMIIEHFKPNQSRASFNGSTGDAAAALNPPSSPAIQTITDLPQPQLSSAKSSSSQLLSSQSIYLSSSPAPNHTSISPPRPSSLTPPPPVEIERAQLKKQIHDALQNQQAIQQPPIGPNDSKLPTITPDNNNLVTPTENRTPKSSLQMPRSSVSPSQANVIPTPQSKSPASSQKKQPKTYYDTRGSLFSWDTYLEMYPAEPAPREAFRQPKIYPKNMFIPGMKLRAKDPRKASDPHTAWALATVVSVEGLHVRLRFLGTDAMNDLYELIDSENIQPLDDNIDKLYAPAGYSGNIGQYQKFVEKVMRKDLDCIAPPSIFHEPPRKPRVNLFQPGMKLEAVDRKNKDFIYPATVGEVIGDKIKIIFDGWRGSFDYFCEYYSRDIFPINWCRDVGRLIQAPNGWFAMLEKGVGSGVSPPFYPAINGAASSSSQVTTKSKSPKAELKPKQHKKRGRPKTIATKRTTPSKIYTSTPKAKDSDKFRSPKKVKPVTIESNDHSYASKIEVREDAGEEDDDDRLVPVNLYQCQRTVTFEEWKKKKLEEKVSQQELGGDTRGRDISVDQSSSGLSDRLSMASPVPVSRDSGDINGDDSRVKKQRIDDSSSSSTQSASTNEKLEQMVASKPKKLSKWSVDDVIEIIKTEDSLSKYVQVFQENEIDGLAFGLFGKQKTEMLMHMGLKMGPVLKVLDLRERVIPYLDMSDIVKT